MSRPAVPTVRGRRPYRTASRRRTLRTDEPPTELPYGVFFRMLRPCRQCCSSRPTFDSLEIMTHLPSTVRGGAARLAAPDVLEVVDDRPALAAVVGLFRELAHRIRVNVEERQARYDALAVLHERFALEAECVVFIYSGEAVRVPIRADPILKPLAGLRVVEVDALARAAERPRPVFEDAAAVRDALDDARARPAPARVVGVPLADPEVELPVFGPGHAGILRPVRALCRRGGGARRRVRLGGAEQNHCDDEMRSSKPVGRRHLICLPTRASNISVRARRAGREPV